MERQSSYLIPINFSLTQRAKDWIRETTKQCRAEKSIDPVPAIVWMLHLIEPDGSWHELGAPGLGMADRGELPIDSIQNLDGMELVFNVTPEQVPLFEGRSIDYSEDRGLHFAV